MTALVISELYYKTEQSTVKAFLFVKSVTSIGEAAEYPATHQGTRRGRGWGGFSAPPPTFFAKIKINLTENNLTKITEPKMAPHSETCCAIWFLSRGSAHSLLIYM